MWGTDDSDYAQWILPNTPLMYFYWLAFFINVLQTYSRGYRLPNANWLTIVKYIVHLVYRTNSLGSEWMWRLKMLDVEQCLHSRYRRRDIFSLSTENVHEKSFRERFASRDAQPWRGGTGTKGKRGLAEAEALLLLSNIHICRKSSAFIDRTEKRLRKGSPDRTIR